MQKSWLNRCMKTMDFVMAMLLAVMAVIVFLNVVLRYAFHSGIGGAEDISRFLFVWLSFIGAVAAMATHGHLGVDILVQKLPRSGRRIAGVVSHILMIVALFMLTYGSWKQMLINNDTMAMGAIAYPLSWNYAAGVFAGIGCLAFVLRGLLRVLRGDLQDIDFDANAEIVNEVQVASGSKGKELGGKGIVLQQREGASK
ncbi:TRAP transporter small permease [Allopusillimonas ginsengisoli]|uniref:TRAP transporter small permease n=1 Tax=Allopusillimonas ginsengisoli TaxID=453575 RepID=UPI0010C1D65A|nr:TRAP transporter small permease [Allopusillimonas ginsengisoli]